MGEIHILTGDGGGKTIAALGLALRAAGHKQKVIMIQFMKGRETGEFKIQKKIPHFEMHQFGHTGFVNPKNPTKRDYELAQRGLSFAFSVLKRKPKIIILDEINIAVKFGLLKERDILIFLDKVPKRTLTVLTGRYAPKSFIKRADLVIEMRQIKEPKKISARKGVEW